MYKKRRIQFCATIAKIKQRKNAFIALLFLTFISFLFLFLSLETVVIKDGSSVYKVRTFHSKAENILRTAGINYSEDDLIVFTNPDAENTEIKLTRAFPVTITVGSESKTINFTGGTVDAALRTAGIVVDENDIINIDTREVLSSPAFVDVINVDYLLETCEETVPHSSVTVYSSTLASGKTNVTEGEDGVKLVTYRKKLVNGEITDTDIIEEQVVKSAVKAQRIIGTKKAQTVSVKLPKKDSSSSSTTKNDENKTEKPKEAEKPTTVTDSSKVKSISTLTPKTPIELDASGRPVKFKKVYNGKATAYTAGKGAVCSTGVKPQPGYVAVNPKIIPYGTKLYIKTADGSYIYGYAVAADTGGFANSNNILVDLFFTTKGECINFGVRNVEVYVLE